MVQHNKATKLTLDIARVLDAQQAENVLVFEVKELTSITDFFVIATGKNLRHLKALAREVCEHLEKIDKTVLGEEGTPESGWILIDAGDIVVHIFDERRRSLYNLEMLWGDARELTGTQKTD